MAEGAKPQLRPEIARVFFIDLVGYSTLLIDEQAEVVRELHQTVRDTGAVQNAKAA